MVRKLISNAHFFKTSYFQIHVQAEVQLPPQAANQDGGGDPHDLGAAHQALLPREGPTGM